MLSSVLPGLRSMRAPLAAGTLIVATIYVVAGEYIASALDDERLGKGLRLIREQLPQNSSLLLLSVLAYLIGSIYVSGRNTAAKFLAATQAKAITRRGYLFEAPRGVRMFVAPFSRTSIRRLGMISSSDYDEEFARRECLEIIFSDGMRLLSANKDLYDEFDRVKAEAEFRDAVAIPGLMFTCTALANIADLAAWTLAVVATVAVAVAGSLSLQARWLDRMAWSTHAHAVADHTVPAAIEHPDKNWRRRWFEAAPSKLASGEAATSDLSRSFDRTAGKMNDDAADQRPPTDARKRAD
jgi:hypothetical protein